MAYRQPLGEMAFADEEPYYDDEYEYEYQDEYGAWYGNDHDYPDGAQVVVHAPPSGGTFNEALKTGLGLGLGFVAVFATANLIGAAMARR
jgi:hypothetical protein